MPSLVLALGAVLLAAAPALARTDLTGCTYYDSVVKPSQQAAYATRIWYVPDTGELCDFLDCGGGRAPPKTTVPGCPQYEGTATYSPSFINPQTLGRAGGGSGAPATTSTAAVVVATTDQAGSATLTTEVRTTAAPSVAGTASGSGSSSGSGSVSSAAASASASAKSAESSKSGASPSASTSGGDEATGTTGTAVTGTAATHTGAAAGLPTAAAVLGPCLLAGVAAGMGMF